MIGPGHRSVYLEKLTGLLNQEMSRLRTKKIKEDAAASLLASRASIVESDDDDLPDFAREFVFAFFESNEIES